MENEINSTCGIDKLCDEFKVKDINSVYNTLLRAGNKYGVKVLHEESNKVLIPQELLDDIAKYRDRIAENVPSIDTIRKNATPNVPFRESKYVYFLLNDEDIIYIGLSTNLARRMGEHTKTKPVNRVFYIESDDYEILESFCISQYMPELNAIKLNALGLLEVCAFHCISKL